MSILENFALLAVYVGFLGVFVCFVLGLLWLCEKIGSARWFRGWLWYFGIIEECPDAEPDR